MLSTLPSPHNLDYEEGLAEIVNFASNAKVADCPDVYT